MDKVVGKNVLVVGDLHISDTFSGKHKDYKKECTFALDSITKKLEDVRPAALFLLGDIVGNNETNIRSRENFTKFCRYFMQWNAICPVYSVRGNHDMKGYPDFDALHDLGLIKIFEDCDGVVDFYTNANDSAPQVRFHIVDYGAENRELDIYKGDDSVECSNVVLGHNNYFIEGVTIWYAEYNKVMLNQLRNFKEVDMVVAGHIHNPSPEIYETNMDVDKVCSLFYLGCPTRPIKDNRRYDFCWYMNFEYDETENLVQSMPEQFELLPFEDIYYEDKDYITDETVEDIAEKARKETLAKVLGDLAKYQVESANITTQILNIPNATDEAKELAVKYIEQAMAND